VHAGGPLFCVGNGVLRQVLVIEVWKHRSAGNVVACLIPATTLAGSSPLSDCR
jgi:hypothetical protein